MLNIINGYRNEEYKQYCREGHRISATNEGLGVLFLPGLTKGCDLPEKSCRPRKGVVEEQQQQLGEGREEHRGAHEIEESHSPDEELAATRGKVMHGPHISAGYL
jgi:hypothetical protein